MRLVTKRTAQLLAIASAGVVLQLGGCASLLGSVNPCGSVLNCDFTTFEFVTSGIDGPGVIPEVDPFCTFPPFCTPMDDPIFGGLGGAGG